MSQLHTTTLDNGDELIRMPRPSTWDHVEWCQEPGCQNLDRSGARVRNRNVWGYQPAGDATQIGWRGACDRKHALSVWRREVLDLCIRCGEPLGDNATTCVLFDATDKYSPQVRVHADTCLSMSDVLA